MDPTGLVAAFVGIVERLVTRRQRIILRAGTSEVALMSVYPYDDAHTVVNRQGTIRIYNGGPGRVTVNEAGWDAKDGSHVEAHLPSERTLEPGSAEIEATADPAKLLAAHDGRGGLVRMWVVLAGDEKPRRRGLPDDWIGKIRTLSEK